VSEIVLGYREIIPSELTTQLVEKHTPLSGQFPFVAEVFDTTEEEEELALAATLMAVTDSSSSAGRSPCFVKELSLEELGDLSATLEASQLPINPLSQCELGSYLKQQGLPPPWVSCSREDQESKCGLRSARHSVLERRLVQWMRSSHFQRVAPWSLFRRRRTRGDARWDRRHVFSTSFVYRNLFASIALRDHLEPLCRGRLLPLYVLVLTSHTPPLLPFASL
jgi:hypothetical protein